MGKRTRRASTVLELIAVITVMAILAAAGYVTYRAVTDSSRDKAAAVEMRSMAVVAQGLAVLRRDSDFRRADWDTAAAELHTSWSPGVSAASSARTVVWDADAWSRNANEVHAVVDGAQAGLARQHRNDVCTLMRAGVQGDVEVWTWEGLGANCNGHVALERDAGHPGHRDEIGVPAAPSVTVTPGNGSLSVTWSVADDGGVAISGYTVSVDPADTPIRHLGATANSSVVGGLTNGVTYTVTVTVTNASGSSSASATGTPRSVPARPDAPHATAAGASRIEVTFDAPDAAGDPITSYRVTPSNGPAQVVAEAGTVVFDGLNVGDSYTFTVAAANSAGWSLESPASPPVTVIGAPGAPEHITVTAGNAALHVTWDPVASTSAAPVTGYRVFLDGVQVVTTASTSANLTGLTNGHTYLVLVVAYGAAGQGAAPAAVEGTPLAVPDAPTAVQAAVSGDRAVTVSFELADDGGATVDDIRVVADPGSLTLTSSGDPVTFSGLTAGTTYTFSVSVHNDAGWSMPATATLTAIGPPETPTLDGSVTADAVQLSWQAAASAAAPVTGWRVLRDGVQIATVPEATTSYDDGDVAAGVTYRYSVQAYNPAGATASDTFEVVTILAPATPTNLRVSAQTATTATLAWDAAGADPTRPVTGYEVVSAGAVVAVTDGATNVTVADLQTGVTYRFSVRARNSVFTGDASEEIDVTLTDVPGQVGAVTAATSATPRTLEVSWAAVVSSVERPVNGYRVFVDGSAVPSCQVVAPATSCDVTVTGTGAALVDGTGYQIEVAAFGPVAGQGPRSTPVTGTTAAPPDVPGTPDAVGSSLSVTATWEAGGDGGSPVVDYTTEIRVEGAGSALTTRTVISPTVTFDELATDTGYVVRVQARNAVGSSAWSAWSPVATTAPAAVTGVAASGVTGSASTLEVSWSALTPAPSGYRIYLDGTYAATATGTTATLSGLSGGTSYTVTVRAYNTSTANEGPASVPVAAWTAPSYPVRYTPTVSGTSRTFTWDPVPGAVSYQYSVQWNGDSAGSGSWTTTATSNTSNPGYRGTRFRFQVRGVNADGVYGPYSSWSPYSGYTAPNAVPTPTDSVVSTWFYRLSWTEDPFADDYEITRSVDYWQSLSTKTVTASPWTENTMGPSGSPGATKGLRGNRETGTIKACNAAGCSPGTAYEFVADWPLPSEPKPKYSYRNSITGDVLTTDQPWPGSTLYWNWGTGLIYGAADFVEMHMYGYVTMPRAGNYQVRVVSDDGNKIYTDDSRWGGPYNSTMKMWNHVSNWVTPGSRTSTVPSAQFFWPGERLGFWNQMFDNAGTANYSFQWTCTSTAGNWAWTAIPTANAGV